MSGNLETVALTVDPEQVREAVRQWRGRNQYGLTLRPAQFTVGLLYMVLGIGGLILLHPPALASMPAIASTAFVILGAVSALQGIGRFDFQPRPLAFVTMKLDDAAIVITDVGGTRQTFGWQAVKSVQRTNDALVFVLNWRRAIVVPSATPGFHQSVLWPQLYAHLVSRRGLIATPFAHANEIVNTGLT